MIFSTKKNPSTYSVKPGSSLTSWYEKTKKYISHKRYILKLRQNTLLAEFKVKDKMNKAFALTFNIIGTGAIIWYCIHHKNFVSYGLISVLSIYYFGVFVDKIKQPYKKEE